MERYIPETRPLHYQGIVPPILAARLPFPYSMNKELTESSLLILSMVSARRLATLS
jgi:hypothetical protein